jgi:hypothetical protein
MDYDIKKGWFKKIDGDALGLMMGKTFGNIKKEGDVYVSSYGVLEEIRVTILSKDKLDITTKNRDGPMTDEEILDSKRKLNAFTEQATGFDAKARMKRAQKKAKEGTL